MATGPCRNLNSADLKILPLHCYDMIIGMDWLEEHNPMKVHWRHKWSAIPHQGSTTVLHGISTNVPSDTILQLCSVIDDSSVVVDIEFLSKDIQALLLEFALVFEKPTKLPPSRACDHSIPLIPGATPVNIESYRYPCALKSEI